MPCERCRRADEKRLARLKKRRARLIAAGKCRSCLRRNARPPWKSCDPCRERGAEWKSVQAAEATLRGDCSGCFKRKAVDGMKSCAHCLKQAADRKEKRDQQKTEGRLTSARESPAHPRLT